MGLPLSLMTEVYPGNPHSDLTHVLQLMHWCRHTHACTRTHTHAHTHSGMHWRVRKGFRQWRKAGYSQPGSSCSLCGVLEVRAVSVLLKHRDSHIICVFIKTQPLPSLPWALFMRTFLSQCLTESFPTGHCWLVGPGKGLEETRVKAYFSFQLW